MPNEYHSVIQHYFYMNERTKTPHNFDLRMKSVMIQISLKFVPMCPIRNKPTVNGHYLSCSCHMHYSSSVRLNNFDGTSSVHNGLSNCVDIGVYLTPVWGCILFHHVATPSIIMVRCVPKSWLIFNERSWLCHSSSYVYLLTGWMHTWYAQKWKIL